MSHELRVGLAGTGFIGATHRAAWMAEGARVLVHDVDMERAAALAARFGADVAPSLDALLASVDVVDVCTPTHLHAPIAIATAQAGRHVTVNGLDGLRDVEIVDGSISVDRHRRAREGGAGRAVTGEGSSTRVRGPRPRRRPLRRALRTVEAPTCAATDGIQQSQVEALADALLGRIPFRGGVPVRLETPA